MSTVGYRETSGWLDMNQVGQLGANLECLIIRVGLKVDSRLEQLGIYVANVVRKAGRTRVCAGVRYPFCCSPPCSSREHSVFILTKPYIRLEWACFACLYSMGGLK